MKWYKNRDIYTGELFWWTQRDSNGNYFEIRQSFFSKDFRLFMNDRVLSDYNTLADAQRAAHNHKYNNIG